MSNPEKPVTKVGALDFQQEIKAMFSAIPNCAVYAHNAYQTFITLPNIGRYMVTWDISTCSVQDWYNGTTFCRVALSDGWKSRLAGEIGAKIKAASADRRAKLARDVAKLDTLDAAVDKISST